ncbi:MAG TPA: ATP-binding protein [Vicinamibacterales bacterium]|jgi:two-component system sensor histidine kinase BaeS
MKWYQSLYWRIAIGVIGCLALLLIVQGVLFVWLVGRLGAVPNQPPDRFAQTVAFDVSQALERDPSLNVEKYLRDEYSRDAQPFFAVLADGKTIAIAGTFPEQMIDDARTRLTAIRGREQQFGRGMFGRERGPFRPGQGPPPFERGDQGPPPGHLEPGQPFGRGDQGSPSGRGEPGSRPPRPFGGPYGRGDRGDARAAFRGFRPAPIIAQNRVAGLVVVPPEPPFRFLLTRYAPVLGSVAIITLVVGGLIATVAIFGPARRRLRAVEQAARALGGGDLTARAPAGGTDEVAAVATAFNAMADDLAARAEALASSNRARRQLLADVSHELTTPVTAISGYLETLTMPGFVVDEPTRARYLGIIGDETARLERIIGDLLELARLEGGGGSFSVADVDVAQLFDRVVARHERTAAAAGVTIGVSVEPSAERVRGDAGRLEQALQNLAANALRYSPSGSAVELRARRDDGGVTLTVTDAGPGIAPEHLPRVFDRFYKAEESRAARQGAGSVGGSGLGLSIVKAIAERHGGTVAVQSEPGHTTFSIAGLLPAPPA